MQVLHQLPAQNNPNLLIGSAANDDAGVYLLNHDKALVQSVDFFTPVVDDAYSYGQIAAANSLSDIYAMGGEPITALNILGYPNDILPNTIVAKILKGASETFNDANCVTLGGHTINIPEPIFGAAVTGIVNPNKLLKKNTANPEDLIILTKPLGTGIITTAVKHGLYVSKNMPEILSIMKRLNSAGPDLASIGITTATDVTGFGLIGHLSSICSASNCSAELWYDNIPVVDNSVYDLIKKDCVPGGSIKNRLSADKITNWGMCPEPLRIIISDAQTSGGLLICTPRHLLKMVSEKIVKHGGSVHIIGNMTEKLSSHISILKSNG